MSYAFQPMNAVSARVISTWQYPPPYDIYNVPPDAMEKTVEVYLDPQYAYHYLLDEQGKLVAFCCFGSDAQVPGGDYSGDALDIGLGIRPDLCGRGRGSEIIDAVLEFARGCFGPTVCRVTIAEFNRRALRVWNKAGFEAAQTFSRRGDGQAFVVLTRECSGMQ